MLFGDGRLVALFALVYYLGAVSFAILWLRRARRRVPQVARDALPGITLLKPLQGIDEELEANLESFANLDYPRLQIVFACQSPNDPALAVARSVVARHPDLDVVILAGTEGTACSPKVLNLEAMLPHARHDWVMISDSNVRIAPHDLLTMAAESLDSQVGLVYQPVIGILDRSAPAAVENLRLTEYGGTLTMALKMCLGLDVVMGKGMLMRRTALASVGDFAAVRDVAADDYVLGETLSKAGWKLVLSSMPARVVHIDWSWKGTIRRQLRHSAMRVRLGPWTYLFEMFFSPIAVSLLPLALSRGGTWWVCVLAIVVKTAAELTAGAILRRQPPRWIHVPLVTVKDLLMVGVWFAAIFSNRVEWRGRTFRMRRGSRLELIGPNTT